MINDFVKTFLNNQGKLTILGLLFLLTASCRSTQKNQHPVDAFFTSAKFDEDDFAEVLGKKYGRGTDADTPLSKKPKTIAQMLHVTYRAADYMPLWLTEEGNADVAEALVKELEALNEEGLNPGRYETEKIKLAIRDFKENKEPKTEDIVALDTLCTKAYIMASRDLLLGMIRPAKADSLWFHDNDTTWNVNEVLVKSLTDDEQYPTLNAFRSELITYKILKDARKHYYGLTQDTNFLRAKLTLKQGGTKTGNLLGYIIKTELPMAVGSADDTSDAGKAQLLTSFQEYYGLNTARGLDERTMQYLVRTPDSVLLVIDANLERTRWLPRKLTDTHVMVNIPMMELYFRKGGENTMHMRTVVGKTARQTPSLNAAMKNVVVNPTWGVPPTIMKKDVLPGMAKNGKAYLDKKGLKVYDFKGNPVNPSKVNESNYKTYVFRQAPGDDNALGYVKFNLPNDHDIYLHDTPHRELFDNYDRAQSSGCVRVQQPRELAEYILSEVDGKRSYNRETIDSLIRTQKTKFINITNDIPVHIVYFTAFENAGNNGIRFSRDIYQRDLKLINLLKNG